MILQRGIAVQRGAQASSPPDIDYRRSEILLDTLLPTWYT